MCIYMCVYIYNYIYIYTITNNLIFGCLKIWCPPIHWFLIMFPVHPCSHVQSFSDKAIIEIQRSGPYLQPIQHWSCSAVTVVYRSCVSENGKETAGKTGVCLEIWCHKIQYNPMIHHIFPFEIAILWTSWYPPFSDPGTNNPSFTATPGITTLLTGELLQLRSSSSHQSTFAACPCRSTRALLGQDTWQQKIHAVAKVKVLSKGAV